MANIGKVLTPFDYSGSNYGDYGYEINGVKSSLGYVSRKGAENALHRALDKQDALDLAKPTKSQRVLLTAEHSHNVKHVDFTAKQAERLAELLDVASQSTDSATDSELLDRLARILTA